MDQDVFLPEWAERTSRPDEYIHGTQLCTKDGRVTGNAVVIETKFSNWDRKVLIYHVVTDAGTEMRLTIGELKELFYPPIYVMKRTHVRTFVKRRS